MQAVINFVCCKQSIRNCPAGIAYATCAQKSYTCRLVEEADLQSAKELFGGGQGSPASALDSFEPKSLKDHEELARLIAQQYLLPHSKNQHYKTLLKALLKQACPPVGLPEVKDLETCLAGIKSEKLKEEKAAKANKTGMLKVFDCVCDVGTRLRSGKCVSQMCFTIVPCLLYQCTVQDVMQRHNAGHKEQYHICPSVSCLLFDCCCT